MISRGTFFIYKNTLATFIARVFLKENSFRNMRCALTSARCIMPY